MGRKGLFDLQFQSAAHYCGKVKAGTYKHHVTVDRINTCILACSALS